MCVFVYYLSIFILSTAYSDMSSMSNVCMYRKFKENCVFFHKILSPLPWLCGRLPEMCTVGTVGCYWLAQLATFFRPIAAHCRPGRRGMIDHFSSTPWIRMFSAKTMTIEKITSVLFSVCKQQMWLKIFVGDQRSFSLKLFDRVCESICLCVSVCVRALP